MMPAQSRCNFCHVSTLVARCFDFHCGRQSHPLSADDRGSPVRTATMHLRDTKLTFERIRKPNHHKAEMHQHNMKRYQGSFLAAMLTSCCREDRADFAHQLVLGP